MGSVMTKVSVFFQVVGVLILIFCTTAWAMHWENTALMVAVGNTSANSGTARSAAIDASNIAQASLQIALSDSTAAGTLSLQGSNDLITSANFTPSTWSIIPGASVVVSAGATTALSVPNLSYHWVRSQWVRTSGLGTITVNGMFQEF